MEELPVIAEAAWCVALVSADCAQRPSVIGAPMRLTASSTGWERRYESQPAKIRLSEHAWAACVRFPAYSPEMRKVSYSTNARCGAGRVVGQ
jgi:transposase-like protein